jgi:hypothetical protein
VSKCHETEPKWGEASTAVGKAKVNLLLSKGWRIRYVECGDTVMFEKSVKSSGPMLMRLKKRCKPWMRTYHMPATTFASVEEAIAEANILAATKTFGGWG